MRAMWGWALLAMAIGPAAGAADADSGRPTPVILISIDTLRADHLSAYGYRKLRTPNIDSYAPGGTLFASANSQIPLTLPSHTSLFTSMYPFASGVEENEERVPPGAVTLAAVLRSHGYRTAAFIGGYFLDQRFGLDQGFDFYDSPFRRLPRGPMMPLALRRDGALVMGAAERWLNQNRDQPVLCFVHLFDVHMPYDRPPVRGLSGYDTEVEYVDELLGRFRKKLEDTGWWQRSLVIIFSDHGEGLGDHAEHSHGYFVYQSTLWVPLIFHWPQASQGFAERVKAPVGLIDVAPTILEFLGISAPPSFQGVSLLGLARSPAVAAPSGVYSESVYARDAFGWAPLRALRVGDSMYIQAPHPEIYNLQQDPGERINLLQSDRPEARELSEKLSALLAHFSLPTPAAKTAPSADDLALLESLGYVAGGPHPANPNSTIDPKDRLAEYRLYEHALLALQTRQLSEATLSFRKVLSEDPRNILARFHLGEACLAAQRPREALREWRATLTYDPTYAPAAQSLGEYWLNRNENQKARVRLEQAVSIFPNNATSQFELGLAEERLGLYAEAVRHLQLACQLDPSPQHEQELQAASKLVK